MSIRLTNVLKQTRLRLGNHRPCHRCLATKEDIQPPVVPTPKLSSQFKPRSKNLLLTYINHLYKGQDRRLKSFQSAMDQVHQVKTELGPFKSLDDLTTKVGLSFNEAVGLCEIISQISLKKRRNMQFSYPTFTQEDCSQVGNVLAIHTSLYCVVWAHLEKSGRVLSWHKEPLTLADKDKHTIDCVKAVMNFCNKLPVADAYIMETPDVRRAKDSIEANNSFLLASLNCSVLTCISCLHGKADHSAKLYYMNRSIVPLLFELSVGMETVSRFRTVEELIFENNVELPLEFSGIVLDDWLRDLFAESTDKAKEELSIPLLAAIAAMEIFIKQNPHAIDKVMSA